MKTIESIMTQLTDLSIVEDLRKVLREKDREFLPWVEPGNVSDGAQTCMYALELHRYLGFRVCS